MSQGEGWLQISTSGFASFNKARPPGHLVKELVQNSFDAIGDEKGTVALDYRMEKGRFHVYCRDTGGGLEDLDAMRVVYLTHKTDSHLKRGRFGRGFKEILSVANEALVGSGSKGLHFKTEDGQQITSKMQFEKPVNGASVTMIFDWPEETAQEFDSYFAAFLIPPNINFLLNGNRVHSKAARYSVAASLPTEIYNAESSSWKKPRRKTMIELMETTSDEEPFIYEMGIPVANAEWSVPFHANIQQRVPMNPNRDALASGYAKRIHTSCLPTILPDLDAEETTADWVGVAGAKCEADVQQDILHKAFGENAVRSVPSMGKRDYDHDAERTGAHILKTSQMSGGFRDMAKEHLPSAKQCVDLVQEELRQEVTKQSFGLDDSNKSDTRLQWIEHRGGRDHVNACLTFAVWFCQQLVDSTNAPAMPVSGALALGSEATLLGVEIGTFSAHWSDSNLLTLALDEDCFWQAPLGAQALAVLVHEAAHSRNMHHGRGFTSEVERLAGVAAQAMFINADYIRKHWPQLVRSA